MKHHKKSNNGVFSKKQMKASRYMMAFRPNPRAPSRGRLNPFVGFEQSMLSALTSFLSFGLSRRMRKQKV